MCPYFFDRDRLVYVVPGGSDCADGRGKKVAVLQAAGLFKTDSQGKKSIESLYQRAIVMRTLNLDSGEWVTDKTAAQRCKKTYTGAGPCTDSSALYAGGSLSGKR
ncbi:hypothetical protein PYX06_14545 [Citrobacter amalonaticus]|nr:hypothetical protein [Citrobacter amalonaticus]